MDSISLVNLALTLLVGALVFWSGRRQFKKSIRAGLGDTLVVLKNSTEQLQRCLHGDLRATREKHS